MLKVLKEYVNKRVELLKIDITLISSNIVSVFILTIIVLGLFLMFFFMLSLSLSMFLGKALNNYALGVLICSFLYLLLLILLVLFRKQIKSYFINKLANFQEIENDEDIEDIEEEYKKKRMKNDNYRKLLQRKKKLKGEISDLENVITFKKFSTSAKAVANDLTESNPSGFLLETGLNLALGGVYNKFLKNQKIRKMVSYSAPFLIKKLSPLIKQHFFNKINKHNNTENQNIANNNEE